MLKTSLIEILRTFTKEELKKFSEFVNSPYFNKKTSVTRLLDILKEYSPEFKNENLERKLAWKKLFPDKAFNYGVMKNLIYELTKLVERFLTEEMFAEDDYKKSLYLLNSFGNRDLNKLLESEYRTIYAKTQASLHGPDKYENLAVLKWTHYSLLDNMDKKNQENIFEIAEYTIYNFLISIFKIYNNIFADKIMHRNIKYRSLPVEILSEFDFDSLIESIKKYSERDYRIIKIYYDMFRAFRQNNNPGSYFRFKKNLTENDGLLEDYERRNLFACLCTTLTYNETIKNKPEENNDIIKIMHEKNIINDDKGVISIRDYSFGVRMAAMVKDIVFLEEFINTYTKALRPSTVENMKLYGAVYLHFAKREFSKALESVNKINFDILSFKYELKNLQLMLYYELNDFDSLFYAMDSYKHFATGNKFVSEAVRKKIFRFVNYLNLMIKLTEKPDRIKLNYLKTKVQHDTLNSKYWLLEKIDCLILKLKK